jgi:ribose transport system substrate-binding protein
MLKKLKAVVGLALCVGIGLVALSTNAISAEYAGAPRSFLFNPSTKMEISDTTKYKKKGPYTIGFSNAGLGDSWRVVMQHSIMKAAADNSKMVKKLIITNANHDDAKQVADVQDLISQHVDILIVSANTLNALDPVLTRAMKDGIPVVMVDRRIASNNFVSFVTASDPLMGRMWAQWIVEKLHGKGNVVMLSGQAGSSPSENREKPALEVFKMHPGIHVLDTVYSDWSPVKGKQVMAAMIAKHGKKIDAVWSAHGLQTPGSIEAFLAAGYKAGQIPMHTTADVNGPLQLALKYKVPMLEIGYPPAMGGKALEVALAVLQGAAVPKIFEINTQIGLTRGDETPSVPKPDLYIDQMVVKNGPADMLVTGGLGPKYNPTTFKIKYPGGPN